MAAGVLCSDPSPHCRDALEGARAQDIRLLITGLPRCGKSTIKKAVFHSQDSPSGFNRVETDSDPKASIITMSSIVELQIATAGGHRDYPEELYRGVCSIIFVIDLLGDYIEALSELFRTILLAQAAGYNPDFEIFLHKYDGLAPTESSEVFKKITQKAREEVEELCNGRPPKLSFFLTSLYDNSILLAISRVIQMHIPQYVELQSLLDSVCIDFQLDRVYVFDVTTKICLTANSSPYDHDAFDLCVDVIDATEDVESIYGGRLPHTHHHHHHHHHHTQAHEHSPLSPSRNPRDNFTSSEIILNDDRKVSFYSIGNNLALLGTSKAQSAAIPAESIEIIRTNLFKLLNM